MDTLNYEVLAKSGYNGYILKNAPEKVLQFGEGNFLRAFVDYWFDLANEKADWNGKCVLVQPIAPGLAKMINEQEGLYTLYLRGSENGKKVDDKRVISSVSRCLNPYEEEGFKQMMDVAASDDLEIIVSNTTEAGIVYDPACKLEDVPASSFPGKLTQVLYHRYKAGKKGILMLACELIDNNGKELLKCVNQYIDQWGLDDGFRKYVNEDCTFCGSLVDRIVPGRIRDPKEVAELEEKHGYADPLLDVGEVFGVWVIEGDTKLNDILPFRKAGLEDHVFVTPDMSPYKKRKVRILNGAHTGFVLGAYLAGFDIVRDCMHDATVLGYMNKMLSEEVVPILPLDQEDCKKFAAAVEDRFNNPFVNHELMSISLNSTSKWRARNMPSFLEYVEKNGKLPTCLTMSFAAYIAFYTNDVQELNDKGLVCKRTKGNEYTVSDDRWVLEFYNEHKNDDIPTLVHAVMTNEKMFHLMIPCGISSTIFGLVYGSLFGYEEALDPLYHALGMAGKPVSVMDSITGILMVAVYIGIVLVLAAMALNMYTHARHKEWGEFIFSPNGLVGVVTYLCGVDLASAYMGAVTFMPQVVAIIGLVVGLVLLLFAELLAPMVEGKPWQPAGGMGNYLMQSVFELLETVLSYLSNTISFLRVGAFVIVHASMMMVVFTLAGTPNNIVVVILGNLVVICLEALLSAIQGIRLEFYEMFSRCYKGGGRKFVAFDLKKEKA